MTTDGAGGGIGDSASGLETLLADAVFTVFVTGVEGSLVALSRRTAGSAATLTRSARFACPARFLAGTAAARGLRPMPFMIWLGVALHGPYQAYVRPLWNVDHVPGWPQHPAFQV